VHQRVPRVATIKRGGRETAVGQLFRRAGKRRIASRHDDNEGKGKQTQGIRPSLCSRRDSSCRRFPSKCALQHVAPAKMSEWSPDHTPGIQFLTDADGRIAGRKTGTPSDACFPTLPNADA
jgi:hypothetical protein